jgi:hypothetical protein
MNASEKNLQNTESNQTTEGTPINSLVFQAYFLARLKRLVALRSEIASASIEPWKLKALNHAIYSTMLDCERQDAKEEAKLILKSKDA